MKATALDVRAESSKGAALRDLVQGSVGSEGRYLVDIAALRSIPRSPFAYWVSHRFQQLYSEFGGFGDGGRSAQMGLSTFDDFRFLRLGGEVGWNAQVRGVRFAKGGAYARYYADVSLTVNLSAGGLEISVFRYARRPREGARHRGSEHFGRPGVTWSRRSQRGLSLRVLPAAGSFGDKGPAIFSEGNTQAGLLAVLAVGNSMCFQSLVSLQMAFGSYEVGAIMVTPVPDLTPDNEAALAGLARRAWSLKRGLDTRTETSHAFVLPALLQVEGTTLAHRAAAWAERVRTVEAELEEIQAEIDERCFEFYGIDEEDRRSITEGFGGDVGGADDGAEDAEEDEGDEDVTTADATGLAAELVSWAVGVGFGRFDVRLTTGERSFPEEPEPFDALPVCSPGMLTGDDGLPLDRPPNGYPLSFPEDGVRVDDPGHARDLTAAVRTVFDLVFGDRADAIWQEAGSLLDPKGHDLRRWLASGFFEHHLKTHSKSRRKAPIVWRLATSSGRYSVWCYAHRMRRDSLLSIATDVVAPKLGHEERRLESLRTQAGPNPGARERAEIAAQEAFVEELRVFLEEVRRVAPLWDPDLDDGIVLVMAPLWRLVPTHKAWQKELRSRWEDLVAGRYDWAHLAMHLWPERVVPKCATDRSLAIAHGLEEVFWAEGPDGKWTARPEPTRQVEQLIAERTSPAVKAALEDLLAAPAPAGVAGKRGRKVAG